MSYEAAKPDFIFVYIVLYVFSLKVHACFCSIWFSFVLWCDGCLHLL